MKRLLLAGVAALLASACTPYEQPVVDPYPPAIEPVSSSSASSSESGSSLSSEATDAEPADTSFRQIIFADRSYERAVGAKGAAWLDAIGAVKLTGDVDYATMHIKLTRGLQDDGRGWSALGFYMAPVAHGNGFDYPDESVFGTNLNYVDAVWRGDCKRHLSAESSFGVLKEHSNEATYDMGAMPFSAADPCSTESRTVNLTDLINNGGLYLGAMPSDGSYHAYITIDYVGTLDVVTQDW